MIMQPLHGHTVWKIIVHFFLFVEWQRVILSIKINVFRPANEIVKSKKKDGQKA